MNLRSLSIALCLGLLAIFAILNWGAISAPTQLSLGFAQVQAPLGLVMLAIAAGLSGLFLVYIVFQQAGVILEGRRNAKEMKGQRELADQAEASRFTALQAYLADELKGLDERHTTKIRDVIAQVATLERQLAVRVDESTRTLTAYLGEVEDKLDRVLASRPAP